jgi:hypothetical protein
VVSDLGDQQGKVPWRDYVALLALIISIVAAIFTGYHAWVARDTEKRLLRAYVLVSLNSPLQGFVPGQKLSVTAVLDNVGQTPVYNATWISGFNFLPYPLSSAIEWHYACAETMKLPTAQPWFFGKQATAYKASESPLTGDEIARIKAGKDGIYFVGQVCYRDIFQAVHETDFCMVWHWRGSELGNPDYCDTNNSGD